MSTLTLYDYELDENCYKVRLLLAMLGLHHRKVAVNMFPGAEEKTPPFLALNPAGRLPILVDGDLVLHGAEAILGYLAQLHDTRRQGTGGQGTGGQGTGRQGTGQQWLPQSTAYFGATLMWLQFAAVDLDAAVLARRQSLFEAGSDAPELRLRAKQKLRIMDDHMTLRGFDGATWFVGSSATIADVALFPSFALSRDYSVDHEAYPALRRWMHNVRRLPGFMTMPGIPSYY